MPKGFTGFTRHPITRRQGSYTMAEQPIKDSESQMGANGFRRGIPGSMEYRL